MTHEVHFMRVWYCVILCNIVWYCVILCDTQSAFHTYVIICDTRSVFHVCMILYDNMWHTKCISCVCDTQSAFHRKHLIRCRKHTFSRSCKWQFLNVKFTGNIFQMCKFVDCTADLQFYLLVYNCFSTCQ